jgi:predicted DNA-binding transcriptional regulator YafY
MAAMPVGLRARAAFIRQRLYVDTGGWHGTTESLAFLPVVQDAVSRERKMDIGYRKSNRQVSERRIEPLGLVAKGTTWYLVANTKEGFRTFRVSRIEKAAVLDEAVQRPPGFDLAEYWKSSTQRFRETRARYPVVLRAEPRAAEEIMGWRTSAIVPDGAPDPEGWRVVRAEFEDEDHAAFVVQGFGARAEVIEPVSLRERVLANAAALIARAAR